MAFDSFTLGYADKFRRVFPQCFINMQNEIIVHRARNSYFSLKGIENETEFKAKMLEWLSREAIKGGNRVTQKYHLNGINEVIGTNFSVEDMETIYTYLGNGINHKMTIEFVKAGCDINLIIPKEKAL